MSDLRTVVLLFSSLLAACGSRSVDGRAAGEVDVPEGTHTVRITLGAGSISVQPSTDGRIHWEAATRKSALAAEDLQALDAILAELRVDGIEAGELRLVGPELPTGLSERDPGAVIAMKLAVLVPPELGLVLRTGRGPLGVEDREQPVDLATDAGDILLRRVHGPAKTFTGYGNHTVVEHRGRRELEARQGDFLVYVDELAPTGISIVAASGTVQCNLPPGAGFDLTATTGLGEIESPFGIPTESVQRGARQVGEVAGGGPSVVLEAKRGNISVRCKARG